MGTGEEEFFRGAVVRQASSQRKKGKGADMHGTGYAHQNDAAIRGYTHPDSAIREGGIVREQENRSMSRESFDLHWLLGHELRAAARYRRFVALVMVGSSNSDEGRLRFLQGNIRDSDELFDMGGYSAVVMTETDARGCEAALERFRKTTVAESDLFFATGVFPGDEGRPRELVATVRRRLREVSETRQPRHDSAR